MAVYETERSFKDGYLYHQEDVNLKFPLHLHNSFEFISVLNGTLTLTVEETEYTLSEGECTVILPNQAHSYATKEHSSTYLCVFSTDFAYDFYEKTSGFYAKTPVFHLDHIQFLIDQLKNTSNIYRLKSIFYYIFSVFFECGNLQKIPRKKNDLIHNILSYIERNYDKDITLHTVADEVGYTYNYLSNLFHSIFKADFPQLLNECRIDHACRFLRASDASISKIAMSCGYNSLRSFNRNFIQIKGITPSQFREQNNEKLLL